MAFVMYESTATGSFKPLLNGHSLQREREKNILERELKIHPWPTGFPRLKTRPRRRPMGKSEQTEAALRLAGASPSRASQEEPGKTHRFHGVHKGLFFAAEGATRCQHVPTSAARREGGGGWGWRVPEVGGWRGAEGGDDGCREGGRR